MAVVFEAEHQRLGKRVAVKILQPHAAGNAVLRARFEREGRAAVRVQHPNVADVIDVGWEGDWPYIVMELVSGPTLAEVIRREAPMPVGRALELILPVVSALRKAHAARVVHRDVKPANILVSTEVRGAPTPKIVDFGISKILGNDDAAITREHGVVGSLAYMAPEQLRSAAHADERSDQWAAAVVLYECLTGVQPFRGETSVELMRAILEAAPEPPSSRRPELRKELDLVLLKALKAEARDRYPDMRAFGAGLLRFAHPALYAQWARDLEPSADPNVTEDDPSPQAELAVEGARERPRRRSRSPVFLALAFAMVVIGAAGVSRGIRLALAPSASASTSTSAPPVAPAAASATPTPIAPAVSSEAPLASASVSASSVASASAPFVSPHPIVPRPLHSSSSMPSVSVVPIASSAPSPPPTASAKSSTGTLGSPILE
jgi:serine/threonine-protein kinase